MSRPTPWRPHALLLLAAGAALAGCTVEMSTNSVQWVDAQASWELAPDGTLAVTGQLSMICSLDHDFSDDAVSTVWINGLTLSNVSYYPYHRWGPWPMSSVAADRGLPFETSMSDLTPVIVSFSGSIAADPAQLCGARGEIDLYFSLGDQRTRVQSPVLEWPPPAADPCPADGGTGGDAGP